MTLTQRTTSAIFTALPALIFFCLAVFGISTTEYFWKTYAVAASILLGSSLLLGFVLPTVFRRIHLPSVWISIMAGGILALLLSLIVLALLNATPLCVGQDNGDGNNNFGMCIFMTVLSAILYSPIYLLLLAGSAMLGHWTVKKISLDNIQHQYG